MQTKLNETGVTRNINYLLYPILACLSLFVQCNSIQTGGPITVGSKCFLFAKILIIPIKHFMIYLEYYCHVNTRHKEHICSMIKINKFIGLKIQSMIVGVIILHLNL